MEIATVFDDIISFPDSKATERFKALVGLDEVKDHIIKEARLLLNPKLMEEWSKKHHKMSLPLLKHFQNRTPLFIFGGDVGTGKTSLAETFGDIVARQENIEVLLYRLSLNARGTGAVGEMTTLLTSAFAEVLSLLKTNSSVKRKSSRAVILLIDEADALAQSREFAQMHHEDRAGVNALIRGIDNLSVEHLPVLVVMCTNRLEALDPAIKRRGAAIFEFKRPNAEQRAAVLSQGLDGVGFTKDQLDELVRITGPMEGRPYGYTYSDLVRRFLPTLVLDAFPDKPISFDRAMELANTIEPTSPFLSETQANAMSET